MAERPIIFSGPMVRAILDGSKTQTRRMLKPQPDDLVEGQIPAVLRIGIGDVLWVRETWANSANNRGLIYRADGESLIRWKSPIHMPRRLSRLTLRVTDVRVQRLQEISEEDARAEGCEPADCGGEFLDHRLGYAVLWDSLNASRPGCSWQDNPWVCAISFERSATKDRPT